MAVTCAIAACDKPRYGRGVCSAHYDAAEKRGELPPIQTPTPEERFMRFVTRTDSGCWQWNGATHSDSVPQFAPGNGAHPTEARRWAYEHWNGPIRQGMRIGPKCGNVSCVAPAHLEAMTYTMSALRSTTPYKNNKSGFRGVSRQTNGPGWTARIVFHRKNYYLGTYATPEQASAVVEEARRQLVQYGRLLNGDRP
jgi:hypothetical protein